MNRAKQDPLFKRGIWIKEQQGMLTMGTIGGSEQETMVIPDDLGSKIVAFEKEMMDALFGNDRIPFQAEILNIEKLISELKVRFTDSELKISFSNPKEEKFKGSYEEIFNLIVKWILSSLSQDAKPTIYINASLVQGHLCIIYRDSDSVSDPSMLTKEIQYIKDKLNGEASYKKTSENKSYYDIMIPSKM